MVAAALGDILAVVCRYVVECREEEVRWSGNFREYFGGGNGSEISQPSTILD